MLICAHLPSMADNKPYVVKTSNKQYGYSTKSIMSNILDGSCHTWENDNDGDNVEVVF